MISCIIYDVILMLAGIFCVPVYLLKKRRLQPFWQRIVIRGRKHERSSIWLHAVSVGEVILVRSLVKYLEARHPEYDIVISTITPAGKHMAEKLYGRNAEVIYLPLDLSFLVQRAIQRVNPRVFIAVETELWPQLYRLLDRKAVPILLLNARISPRSRPWYRLIRPVLKQLFRSVRWISAQTAAYADIFVSLGAHPEQVLVGGNLKFENIRNVDQQQLQSVQSLLQPVIRNKPGTSIVVAGSTHVPEDEYLIDIFTELRPEYEHVRLILCPRHPERSEAVISYARSRGVSMQRLSECLKHPSLFSDAMVVDRMGVLFALYSFADVVYVGGSLTEIGGHNILEPAYFAKPIIFGKYMYNFQDIRDLFIQQNAAWEVPDREALKQTLRSLLSNSALREQVAGRVRSVCRQESEVLRQNTDLIEQCLQ